MNDTLLAVDGLVAGYGDSIILENVSIELAPRGSLALLGRNGVGKTTLIASLLGLTRIHRGTIAYARAHAGMGWIPQERDIFPSLTVKENLTVIARPGPWTLERVYGLFPRLEERSRNLGDQLSGGEQQMLAIGRALMLNPKLLLLDEPFEGLAPNLVAELEQAIGLMMAEGIAMLLVEQHVEAALRLSENAVVLERGRVTHAGPSAGLRQDRALLESLIAIPTDRA
jgi:branched-chain amino acid transport system ATP-binding protein